MTFCPDTTVVKVEGSLKPAPQPNSDPAERIAAEITDAFKDGNPNCLVAAKILHEMAVETRKKGGDAYGFALDINSKVAHGPASKFVDVRLDTQNKLHLMYAPLGEIVGEQDPPKQIFSSDARYLPEDLKQRMLKNGWHVSEGGTYMYQDWVSPVQLFGRHGPRR